jgi:hypothetical protein
MKKYEYKTQVVNTTKNMETDVSEIDRVLNEMGQKGWELIETATANMDVGFTKSIFCFFKREIID